MRVLHVISGLDARFGGPPFASVATAIAVRLSGIENRLVFPFDVNAGPEDYPALELLRAGGVPTTTIPLTRWLHTRGRRWAVSLTFPLWLARRVRRYDVIHAEGGWTFTTLVALFVGRLSRSVVILTPHESLTDFDISRSRPLTRIGKRLLRRLYLRSFDAVVTSSRLEQIGTDETRQRTVVVYHAVAAPLSLQRHPTSLEERSFVVGYLGRLDPKKNVEILLDVLPHLPAYARLLVAGAGAPEYQEALRERAQTRGVDDRVEWLGFVGALGKRSLFEEIDILAIPSAYECFSIVAAEAMAAGVPVLITRQSGVAEAVEQNSAAILVDPTLSSVLRGLADAVQHPEALVGLAERAQAVARSEFSLEAHGTRLVAVYKQALARRRSISVMPHSGATR